MKNVFLTLSFAVLITAMSSCQNNCAVKEADMNPQKQEREFLRNAIKEKSPDVMRVDIIDSTLVYTHIYDGIIDVKAYTFDGDECVEVERVYTFPTQMSALRHYRRAVERAELYNDIQLHKNQVKYNLKEEQHKLETKGMTKEQLKAKFDKQIADCKADAQRHHDHHRK